MPCLSALSVQIVEYFLRSVSSDLSLLNLISANLLSSSDPSKNHNNSETTPFHARDFVVTAGKPSFKSNSNWCPKEDIVPVFVLSSLSSPYVVSTTIGEIEGALVFKSTEDAIKSAMHYCDKKNKKEIVIIGGMEGYYQHQ